MDIIWVENSSVMLTLDNTNGMMCLSSAKKCV